MNRPTGLFLAFILPVMVLLQFCGCGFQYDESGNRKLVPCPLFHEFPSEINGQFDGAWVGNQCQLSDGETAYYLVLQGVNNPDSTARHEQQSCDHLCALLARGPVRAVVVQTDELKRGIARLYVGDMDVNLEMILSGYARYDGTSFEGANAFAEAEQIARKKLRGIWKP